jgi:hypothetical protein
MAKSMAEPKQWKCGEQATQKWILDVQFVFCVGF